jgi:hypothetical protein
MMGSGLVTLEKVQVLQYGSEGLAERGERKVLFGATVAINAVATAAMLVGPALPTSVFPTRLRANEGLGRRGRRRTPATRYE